MCEFCDSLPASDLFSMLAQNACLGQEWARVVSHNCYNPWNMQSRHLMAFRARVWTRLCQLIPCMWFLPPSDTTALAGYLSSSWDHYVPFSELQPDLEAPFPCPPRACEKIRGQAARKGLQSRLFEDMQTQPDRGPGTGRERERGLQRERERASKRGKRRLPQQSFFQKEANIPTHRFGTGPSSSWCAPAFVFQVLAGLRWKRLPGTRGSLPSSAATPRKVFSESQG